MEQKYNLRSPAVKRLMREAQELHQPTEEFYAHPLEDNLFEWHFTVRGQPESDFDGGLYHGRIILPPEYPMKPPSIILLTPNGRFEVNKKICLSISGHHPESWQPCWSIRTALLAIIGFMPTPGKGAIGSLDYTPVERQILAKKSQNWKCKVCGHIKDCLMKRTESFSALNQEAKELAAQISFKSEVDSSEAAVKNGMAVPEKLNLSRNPVESSGETEKSSQRPMPNDVSLNSVIKTGSSTDNKDAECSPHSASSNSMSSPVQASSIKDINSSSNNPESITSENALRQRYQVSSSENTVLNKPNNESNPSTQCNSSTVIIFLIILVISGLLFRRIFLL